MPQNDYSEPSEKKKEQIETPKDDARFESIKKTVEELSVQISQLRLGYRDLENWLRKFEERLANSENVTQNVATENRDLFLVDINSISENLGKTNEIAAAYTEDCRNIEVWAKKENPSLLDENNKLISLMGKSILVIETLITIQEEQVKPALKRLQDKIIRAHFADFG